RVAADGRRKIGLVTFARPGSYSRHEHPDPLAPRLPDGYGLRFRGPRLGAWRRRPLRGLAVPQAVRRGVEEAPAGGLLRGAAPRGHRTAGIEPAAQGAPQGDLRLPGLRPADLQVGLEVRER